jgi:hypothetical protein
VDEEFGKGLSPPSYGWASMLRTLELAIAAGPFILFNPKKWSNNRIARSRLTTVSGGLSQIYCFSYFFTMSLALGAARKHYKSLSLVSGKKNLAGPDQDRYRQYLY